MVGNLKELREAYNNNKVVPFIGAGLSTPFNVPTWGELIIEITEEYADPNEKIGKLLKDTVEWHLETNDYWGAIDSLKKYANLIDQDVQKAIVRLIKHKKIEIKDSNKHNYSDLAEMNFKLYLTTNYENILHDHLNCDELPILLKNMEFSSQDIFDEKRICHLHGYTADPGSIVISRSSYEKLYSNQKYGELLKSVTSSKHLLFLGFSFDDMFVSNLIKDYKNYLNGMHYILLANPTQERMRELREEYGLITIPYNVEGSSHVAEIRKILRQIAQNDHDNKDVGSSETNGSPINSDTLILGAGLSDFKQDLSSNLFYRKLKLENINRSMIELSSIFYVASEKYIRALKKAGLPIKVIEAILFEVFIKYKESYVEIYEEFGDSKQLLKKVHETLASYDFGRYAILFEDRKSSESENKGLIHLLAEDETMGVWWGKGRFNEQNNQ